MGVLRIGSSMLHCSSNIFKKFVLFKVIDVVNTYKSNVFYWPRIDNTDEPHPFNFILKMRKYSKNIDVWFTRQSIGTNTLPKITKNLLKSVLYAWKKRLINKKRLAIGIIMMEEALMPIDKRMEGKII